MEAFMLDDMEATQKRVNEWLEKRAGKIIVKQRIFTTTNVNGTLYPTIILFYEEVLKTEVRFMTFWGENEIAPWLAKMQFGGKYFRIVRTKSTMSRHDGNPPSRDIYYEVEVEAEDPQKG